MNNTTAKTTTTTPPRLYTAARIVLGLIFCLSGLNHVVGLVPMPPMSGDTALFWQGLAQSGYFFPLLGIVELAAGALLAWRRTVPLALVMVAPIIVNVVAFHAVLAPQGLGIAAAVLAAAVYLGHRERRAFAALFTGRSAARSASVRVVEVLMGLVFVASGIAGVLGRTPPPSTAGAAAMMRGFDAAGYFIPMLSGIQVLAGAMLLARRCTGLALMALAPVVIEIVAYRLAVGSVSPRMVLVAAVLLAAEGWLCFAHRQTLSPLVGEGNGIPWSRAVEGAVRT